MLRTFGDKERLQRVQSVDAQVLKKLTEVVDPEGIWKSLQLTLLDGESGEREVASLQCVAFEGMPQWDGPIDLTWGKGLLILSQYGDSQKQRLHFVMQESMARFQGVEESASAVSKSILASSGTFSSKGSYTATRGVRYLSIPLEVETHIFGVSAEMADVATLWSRFGGGGGWSWRCCDWLRCCKCRCCFRCKCSKCCKGLCTKIEKAETNVWNGAMDHRPRFTDMVAREEKEHVDQSYTFDGHHHKGRETRDFTVQQMHVLKFVCQLPSQKPRLCTAWLDPSTDVRSGLKVVSSLRVSSAQMSRNDGPAIQYPWLPTWVTSWKASMAFPDKNAVYTGGAAIRVAVSRKTALLSKRQKIAIIIVLIAAVGGFLYWFLVVRPQSTSSTAECCRALSGKGGLAIDLALRVPQRVFVAIRTGVRRGSNRPVLRCMRSTLQAVARHREVLRHFGRRAPRFFAPASALPLARLQDVRWHSSKVAPLQEMTGGEVIFNMLVEHGVDTVFGYSGGAVLPLIDAFHGKNIQWITSSHEQCSGHSAAAYAKSTGKFGVAIVTSGPGLTNLVTPMQAKGM
ncbi:ILV2 [Symbiodinium sp. CCMP2456]|nr:ILV2 [Symbiodinium sp. CCMP2456]